MQEHLNNIQNKNYTTYPTTINEGKKYTYNFWKNKPVNNFNEISTLSQQIEVDLTKRKVYGSDEPIKLPDSMKWVEINTNDDQSLENISKFLKTYYLIDKSGKFKLDYTRNFLKWVLGDNSIAIAIESKKNNAICGFVSASFKNLTVFETTKKFAIVNFLCAHPIYRKKKIAFTLIDEIVRRIVKNDVHQGCFTTERCVPSPITTIRFYHRPINYIKLQKYGFTDLEEGKLETEKNPEKIQNLFTIKGCIPKNYIKMTENHIGQVHNLYNIYINRYNIYINYTTDDFKKLLLNNNIVCSYVHLNNDGIVDDFISYYKLNYFMDNTVDIINAGYLFLYTCNITYNCDFIENILKLMANDNIDILNTTDTMIIPETIYTKNVNICNDSDDESFSDSYQFGFLKGSGKIHFNFFNWKCPEIKTTQISWVTF